VQAEDGTIHVFDLPRRTSDREGPPPGWPRYGRDDGNTRGPAFQWLNPSTPPPRQGQAGPSGCSAEIREIGPSPAVDGQVIILESEVLQNAALELYDVSGRLVRRLLDRTIEKGTTRVVWDGRNDSGQRVPNGVFWYRLRYRNGAESRRTVILH